MTQDFFSLKPSKQAHEFFSLLQNVDNDLADIRIYFSDNTCIFSRCKSLRSNNAYLNKLIRTTFNDVSVYSDNIKELYIQEECTPETLKSLFRCLSYPGEFRHKLRVHQMRSEVSYQSMVEACRFVRLVDKWNIHQFESKPNIILEGIKRRVKLHNMAWICQRKVTFEGKILTSKKPLPICDIEPIDEEMLSLWMSYFPSNFDIHFFILVNASSEHPSVARKAYELLSAPDAYHIYFEPLQNHEIVERIFYATLFNVKRPNLIYTPKRIEWLSDSDTSSQSSNTSSS